MRGLSPARPSIRSMRSRIASVVISVTGCSVRVRRGLMPPCPAMVSVEAMAARSLAPDPHHLRSGEFREELAYSVALEMLSGAGRPT